ncbi:hypothetical protein ACFSUS_11235 [Spirosoma soli]|uniref:Outer membrane beta-barrel protein n=1 Tax=Spirosoma soli TaxID=1770529 RepID=A0ABW5M2D9_9BACT
MRNISLVFWLISASVAVQAQEVVIDTNYYAPLPVVRKRVIMDDPDNNSSNRQSKSEKRNDTRQDLLNQFHEIQTWYISAEGGFRNDGSTLNNTLDGLVSTSNLIKATWGVLFGYTYRNVWTVESGYTRSPIHLSIRIANGNNPLTYTYLNNGYGIPFRIKRRLGSAQHAKNGTGFWITAGGWLVPNGSGQTGDFKLIGYSSRGRNRIDTLRLNNTAAISNQVSGLAELGLDYTTRLSSYLELGFYARKYWGLGNALQSELTYTVNNRSQQQAIMTADGTGWGFGLALRYIYGRQHEMKDNRRVP